jgi:hypothetical protein
MIERRQTPLTTLVLASLALAPLLQRSSRMERVRADFVGYSEFLCASRLRSNALVR